MSIMDKIIGINDDSCPFWINMDHYQPFTTITPYEHGDFLQFASSMFFFYQRLRRLRVIRQITSHKADRTGPKFGHKKSCKPLILDM